MRLKTKQYAKLAATSLIAAFSFGLAISCVSNHKQNINKVFAEDDISTTWSYNLNNKALSCTYASNYPNGFIMETNQVSVTGLGEGQYELAYHVLGYPSNSVQPDYTDYGIFTLVFISGSYDSTASEDRPYGSITACPLDVSGLDSETEYEIYLKVEPTGDMNEQGSGEGDDENAGIWTWNQNTQKLSFQFNDTATAGYVSTTSQTMVYGHGNGTYDIGYDLYGTPGNATVASNELLASKTIRLYDGYFNENTATVTGNSSEVAGLESYGQITVAVDVTPSGDLNTDGWRVNDGQLYFYVLADENPASIDSITWNNSSGNGTGEAILSVTISTNGGSFQQVYQINYPTFNPELEGTSGTTLGNTTVEGISEFSDREVTIDISNVTYSLGESTQEVRYTITYYPNGADGEPTNDFTGQVVEGDIAEYMLLENMFSRPDYIFLGWSEDSSSQTPSYEEGEKVYLRSDISYYAIWEYQEPDKIRYTITYYPNGADGDIATDYTDEVYEGDAAIYNLLHNMFDRPNYTFLGWSTDPSSLTANYEEGEQVYLWNDTSYYAVWELDGPKYQYTVTFDGNGATSGSTDPVILSGDDYSQTIVFPECGYEREGYIFKGWGFNSEAIITYKPGEERTDITSDTTFYAIWTQVFTISFDANGGDGIMETITIPEGNATMPECAFTREGYSFAGWAVGSPTGDVYQVGASVYVSANYVLYATWEAITPITDIEISVAESEVVLYVDDSYIIQYTVTPEGAAGELIWKVEDEKVAAVIEDGMLVGLSVGSTTVTISDRSGNTSVSFVVYVVERPVPVQPENPISEETVEQINDAMDTMELTGGQIDRINEAINTNSDYLSDEAGSVIYEALLGTTIDYDDPIVAEAQKELVVTVVETAVQVDAGKATSISEAQEIDKALPETANFSVEGEIDEFYQRQMYELFGGTKPSRLITRAGVPTYEINTDTDGKSGQEGADYLKDQQALYEKMVDFVDDSVDHMGKAALKLRKCSGESVTVSVKSYVTVVKVSSFREFDKEAADKEFVEACYKAILLSMQNQVISILEKEHKPSGNAEKEEQYKKELEAVKDIETFEIMVSEVLRQKYVALTGEQIDDVEDFQPIYWEIFKAWALDMPSPYPITLEELTQTTIEQSTGRAKAFTVNSNLTAGEWGFIAGIAGGSALIIAASAVIPTLLKKKKSKGGR